MTAHLPGRKVFRRALFDLVANGLKNKHIGLDELRMKEACAYRDNSAPADLRL